MLVINGELAAVTFGDGLDDGDVQWGPHLVSSSMNRTGRVTAANGSHLGIECGASTVGEHHLLTDPHPSDDGSVVPLGPVEDARCPGRVF